MDLLYHAAIFYKNHLANRKFNIIATRKSERIQLDLVFLPCHFYHLIGLHKLTDLPFLKRNANSVYQEILTGKIKYADVQKSKHFSEASDRFIFYKEMLNVLSSDSIFFKSLKGKFKGVPADFVLTKSIEGFTKFSFLFATKDEIDYMPRSFFTRDEQRTYTQEGTRWTIVSIKEIN